MNFIIIACQNQSPISLYLSTLQGGCGENVEIWSLWARGGHTRVFLENPYGTLESGGLLSVEKDRKKIGYPTLEEK